MQELETQLEANHAAAALRTALGIGEYVDDAAAGVGGVASGAMYYNTTSSDYRAEELITNSSSLHLGTEDNNLGPFSIQCKPVQETLKALSEAVDAYASAKSGKQ